VANDWVTTGDHLILRPPMWWRRLALAMLIASLTAIVLYALFSMWPRSIAGLVWAIVSLSYLRVMAIIDSSGIRTRGLLWRSYRWDDLEIVKKRRPVRAIVQIHRKDGARVHLPGKLRASDVEPFLPPTVERRRAQ
jgi:hypothetical protein